MQLRKSNWLIRLAFIFDDNPPKRISLCELVVNLLYLPLKTLFILWLLVVVFILEVLEMIKYWIQSVFWTEKFETKRPSVVWEYLKAKKSKVCPIIEIVD